MSAGHQSHVHLIGVGEQQEFVLCGNLFQMLEIFLDRRANFVVLPPIGTVEIGKIPFKCRCSVEFFGQQALRQMGLKEFVQFVEGQESIIPDLVIRKGYGRRGISNNF